VICHVDNPQVIEVLMFRAEALVGQNKGDWGLGYAADMLIDP
jgi:hypothetical protein